MAPASFDAAKDIPDLSGKVIVVTGGNSGLGAASITALAAHNPARIYLAARTRATAESTANSIRAQHPQTDIQLLDLDLSSFASVRAAGETLKKDAPRIDILMLNAGIAAAPPGLSKDGFETHFATNYLGHALLLQMLMPTLIRTASGTSENDSNAEKKDVRVIVVGSRAHTFAPAPGVMLDRVNSDMKSSMGMVRYAHSKLAINLWTRSLAARYSGVDASSLSAAPAPASAVDVDAKARPVPTDAAPAPGRITILSTDPGTVDTGLIRGGAAAHPWLAKLAKPVMRLIGQTPANGARNQLWASVATSDIVAGEYYEPVGKAGGASKMAVDDEAAQKLWSWTEGVLREAGGPGWPAGAGAVAGAVKESEAVAAA